MDLYFFNLINQFAGRWQVLDALAIFFAKYSGYFLIAAALFLFRRKRNIIFQVFLTAIISRFVITEIVRFFWPRLRPFVENNVNLLLSHEASPSFPSGHSAFYLAIATVVYFYNKKAGLAFFAVVFLMGIARIFVGVHWPSDILAGALIGILSGLLVVKLSKKFF